MGVDVRGRGLTASQAALVGGATTGHCGGDDQCRLLLLQLIGWQTRWHARASPGLPLLPAAGMLIRYFRVIGMRRRDGGSPMRLLDKISGAMPRGWGF